MDVSPKADGVTVIAEESHCKWIEPVSGWIAGYSTGSRGRGHRPELSGPGR